MILIIAIKIIMRNFINFYLFALISQVWWAKEIKKIVVFVYVFRLKLNRYYFTIFVNINIYKQIKIAKIIKIFAFIAECYCLKNRWMS